MKQGVSVLGLVVLLVLGSFSIAWADTILFPVIASNPPNVVTVVSVGNKIGTAPYGCMGPCPPGPTHLKYIYRYKDTFTAESLPNTTGPCTSFSFWRPTVDRDLVSFDVSGYFAGGNALFGDPNSYGGGFGIPATGAKRGYLLVTHSDSTGARVDTGSGVPDLLIGEAIVMDIVGGAAWGYAAINDGEREDYGFTFTRPELTVLYPKIPSGPPDFHTEVNSASFTFFPLGPPESWITRFFVTPTGDNMDTANLSTAIRLSSGYIDNNPANSIMDRGGNRVGSTVSQGVTCTGAIDLPTLFDSTALSVVQGTGGWAFLYNNGVTNPVMVYKLEYVFQDPTYGGTNNNAYCLSCRADN